MGSKLDFFISYTSADKRWAELIAYVLEEQNFTTVLQAWDFLPGSNFVLEMQRAASEASRTIIVLSPDYLKSKFTPPEWAAAFGQDPQGLERKVLPVQVRSCNPPGMLAAIVQIRIEGLNEVAAHDALIAGVKSIRAKPTDRPSFPGMKTNKHKNFPGFTASSQTVKSIPVLKKDATDSDKRKFVKRAFDQVKQLFEENLQSAAAEHPEIETDFSLHTNSEFRAEIFVVGKSKCKCRIWKDGMHSENNICYSTGSALMGEGCNEILGLISRDGLHFRAQMGFANSKQDNSFDLQKLTPEESAEYLWQKFVDPLNE